jgi:AcrR family transcriptional regulator
VVSEKSPTESAPSRRGRPADGEQEERRQRVLDAAFAELIERGADKVTMLAIARRAGASKETLYSWFGNREGLFRAMIIENADATSEGVRRALGGDTDPQHTLAAFGRGLLGLLTDERSVALNRASMVNLALAADLLEHGRHRVGPIVEDYLAGLDGSGGMRVPDPAAAFTTFYGLLIRDTQIRVLLGEPAPTAEQIGARADEAARQFVELIRSGA